MASGTSQGARWVAILVLYFILMTTIVTLIGSAVSSVAGINFTTVGTCTDPRTLYTYSGDIRSSDDENISAISKDKAVILGHLECQFTPGAINHDSCIAVSGCSWIQTVVDCDARTWYQIAWDKLTGKTCVSGTYEFCSDTHINASYYNITETWTNFKGVYLAGSIVHNKDVCTDYNLNSSNCVALGCTWLSEEEANAASYEKAKASKLSFNFVSELWGTVSHLATISYDFGFSSVANMLVSLLLFWLPALMLGLAGYQLLRG